jgi:hypothetical protein
MPKRDRRLLEELVYERVRLAIDPGEITCFTSDLARSVCRNSGETQREGQLFAARLVRRAWRRVGNDLFELGAGVEAETP